MDDIELSVRSETDRLLQFRAGIIATVVVLGILAGYTTDLVLGRFFDEPLRQLINVFGLIAMVSVIVLSRSSRPPIHPRSLALVMSFAFCLFMVTMSAEAGPDARTVVVLAYTVMNLGAATLLPWGSGNQLVLVGMVIASTHGSFYLLGQPLLLDPYVFIAMYVGLALSLFLAHYLERTRRLMLRQRFELAQQKDVAEEQREKAEALARDLDAYAHAVAHDLKNPIQTIAGYNDLLEDKIAGVVDEEGKEFLEQTARGCGKMTQIINELLLLASVRKRGTVPSEPLEMGAVVAEVRQRLTAMIEESGAQVVEPEQWPAAVGHAPWVEEIWANYLSNAIKYGGTPPRLELGGESNGNGKVHFWIRDNGPGLSPDQLAHLFDEFSPVAASQTGSHGIGSHGLGLSIVKRIVEKLDGEVSVRSTPGHGSSFGFTLPAVAATAPTLPDHRRTNSA